jgi:hypothetical protein
MPLNADWHVSNNFHLALMMILNCWISERGGGSNRGSLYSKNVIK